MSKRLMQCKCNYNLRFGVSTCPYCFRPTPLRNRYWFWLILLAVAVGVSCLMWYEFSGRP